MLCEAKRSECKLPLPIGLIPSSIEPKAIAREMYAAKDVEFISELATEQMERDTKEGFGALTICVANTHVRRTVQHTCASCWLRSFLLFCSQSPFSFVLLVTTCAAKSEFRSYGEGCADGFHSESVREVRVSAGAGFIFPIIGSVSCTATAQRATGARRTAR